MPEARFEMPDGRTGTLRGASMPEIQRKAREIGATIVGPEESAGSIPLALNNAAGARAMGAVSNVAESALNAPAKAINPLLQALWQPMPGQSPFRPGSPMDRLNSAPAPQIPMMTLPSGQQLMSAVESPIQAVLAGQSLGDAFGSRMESRSRVAADNPGATVAGETLADAASLVALRRPARGPGPGGAFDRLANAGADAIMRVVNPTAAKGGAGAFGALVADNVGRPLMRGAGRVGESALEGLALSAMQGGDPTEMAAAGAGMQVAGSAANTLRDVMIGRPGKFSLNRVGASILAGTVALGMLSEAVPLDQDNPTEALEWLNANFEKIATGAAIGFGVGLLGRRGSVNQRTMGNYFPNAADVLSTLPRAGIIDLVRESTQDETMARVMQNAPSLGESDAKRFMSALESDEPARAVRNLIESNPRMRRILTAPDPRLANVPEMEN